jgi:hypothetical protein
MYFLARNKPGTGGPAAISEPGRMLYGNGAGAVDAKTGYAAGMTKM